ASARLPASRGGHLGAGFFIEDTRALVAELSFSSAHYYEIAAMPSERCKFLQWGGEGDTEFNMRHVFTPDRETQSALETGALIWAVRCRLARPVDKESSNGNCGAVRAI